MPNATIQPSRDWLASRGSSVLAWWIPHAAILAGLFVPTPIRVVIWTIALIWMGAACVLSKTTRSLSALLVVGVIDRLAPGAEKAQRNARRSAIHGTSGKVTARDNYWYAEKEMAAHPQGGKNVERS